MFSPFPVPDSIKEKRYVTDAGRVAVSKSTGEANDILIRRMIMVDPSVFVKVYGEFNKLFSELNMPGIRMMHYLFNNIQQGQDYLYIDVKEAVALLKYKDESNVYRGIKDLISHNVIARKDRDSEYWINTMMFFNGRRREFK